MEEFLLLVIFVAGIGQNRSSWGYFSSGCVCMSSASNGRKNRPRSAGNIFQIGKPPYRDPERRESTESTRKAQRAVADCRMVGLRHIGVCEVLLIKKGANVSLLLDN